MQINIIKKKEKMSETFSILVGDIGGTNIRLNIRRISKDINAPHNVINRSKLSSQKYPSLEVAIEEYLTPYKNTENYPIYAVIGLPGPIKNNSVERLANLPNWPSASGDEYAKKFGLKKFIFLNDFACNAYGVQTNLQINKDYIVINDVPPQEGGVKGIIGPGSGLGNAFLVKNPENKFYTIGSCEGGHMDYIAKNKKHFELGELTKKLLGQDLICIERIASGQGLVPMYKFLLQEEKDTKRDEELGKKVDALTDLKNPMEIDKLNIEIVQKGLKGECPLCKKVLELFVEIFAETAGNMALYCLPTNGMYLVGGLISAMKDIITTDNFFMKHFINKDNFQFLLKTFPVYLVTNGELGILGSAECARRLVEEYEK
jgi:glucokinase